MINKKWSMSLNDLYEDLNSSVQGLSSSEAEVRLKQYGYNQVTQNRSLNPLRILLSQFANPLIGILLFATTIAFFMGDTTEAIIILIIILINSILGFYQEYKAEKTVLLLKKYIIVNAKVLRDGQIQEIESGKIVPGDILYVSAGDKIPADMRLIYTKDFTLDESVLTGESIPLEKVTESQTSTSENPADQKLIAFMGTTALSGRAQGLVIDTGKNTYFGNVAVYLQAKPSANGFQKKMFALGKLLTKITIFMSLFIFGVNFFLGKSILESLLFSLAIAVGITPELLPIIITITLSYGALHMACRKVIVKKLAAIEGFGDIDILCSDKTGTLTEGVFSLHKYFDLNQKEDEKILVYALLCNSNYENREKRIFNNPMDKAIWDYPNIDNILLKYKDYKIIDKTEFDFNKRTISCILNNNDSKINIVKGSPDSIMQISSRVLINGDVQDLNETLRAQISQNIDSYESQGYRVIALAADSVFTGLMIFSDKPKSTVKEALVKIKELNVEIKIITGDSPVITKKICHDLNFPIIEDTIITGNMLEAMTPEQARDCYIKYNVFARITPDMKYKIIASLNKEGHVVGFLGDGINDAPAMKAADVGISVNTGADIAKDAADIILLKKSLRVLADGMIEGRKSFANTIKYILNTISANFGNMITVGVSSFFLPFIPLLPSQILLTNLISDVPLATIATDNVDKEFLLKPKKWNLSIISKFMICFGLISVFYDLALILPLRYIFKAPENQFRTAWFILSCLSEILITFFIRTNKNFWQSRPSNTLIISSIIMSLITVSLPYTSFGSKFFKFSVIPANIIILIIIILTLYCMTVEIFKKYFFKEFER